MIRISQTHIFLKEYVPIHKIGSHFVGGYRLDFSPTEQETKTSILSALALDSPRLPVGETKFSFFFNHQIPWCPFYFKNTQNQLQMGSQWSENN